MIPQDIVFIEDTRDPIRLQLNQDLSGLSVAIRTRNLSTDVAVQAAATIVDAEAGICERPWQDGERPTPGARYAVEAIVTWPAGGGERTHPRRRPLIVQVMPRRTTATTPPAP